MATRLPSPGGDDGQWGALLNDFLNVEHNADGTLKKAGDISTALSQANAKYAKPSGGIPKADLSSSVQASLDNADAVVGGSYPDATTSSNGAVRLAGDLGGTAAAPVIATGAVTGAKIASGAITDSNINGSAAIAQSKISNLTADLAAKAATGHSHVVADVANLQTLLNAKADLSTTTTALNAKANSTDVTTAIAAATAYGIHVALWNGSNYLVGATVVTSSNRPANIYYRYVGGPDPAGLGLSVINGDEWKSV